MTVVNFVHQMEDQIQNNVQQIMLDRLFQQLVAHSVAYTYLNPHLEKNVITKQCFLLALKFLLEIN